MQLSTWLAFVGAWGALVVLPGPDTALCAARTVRDGTRHGVISAVGSISALAFHVTAACLGISALLAASAEAFTVVKFAGAIYLVLLGLRLARGSRGADAPAPVVRSEQSAARTYRQAVLTGILNPKSALFFVTFLPQFVDQGSPFVSLAILGPTAIALAFAWLLAIVAFAARFTAAIAARPRIRTTFERVTGGVFVALGARLATIAR